MRMDHPEDAGIVMQRLVERFRQVDVVLRDRGRADPKLFGIGTTLTVAVTDINSLSVTSGTRALTC